MPKKEEFLLMQNPRTGETTYTGRGESFTGVREAWSELLEPEQKQRQLVTGIKRYLEGGKMIVEYGHSTYFEEGEKGPENKGGVGCTRIFPDDWAEDFLRNLHEGR
jgi:hypothetical protein